MHLHGFNWVVSPTDLVDLLDCDTRTELAIAHARGLPWAPEPGPGPDRLVVAHGEAHEQAWLDRFKAVFGDDLVTIGTPSPDPHALAAASEQTRAALAAGAPVVYQAVFFDGRFYGRADFIIAANRDPHTGAVLPEIPAGVYEPYDTKLARHSRPGAVLQLAAYADALSLAGVTAGERMHLLLGNDEQVSFEVAEFLPVLRHVRERLMGKFAQPASIPGSAPWGQEQPACGSCRFQDHCAGEREQARDLSLVAGIRTDQRRKLRDAGLTTVEALAAAGDTARPGTLSERTFTTLRAQARLQARQDATRGETNPTGTIHHEVIDPEVLAALPRPNPGDIYFDMESDPFALGNTGLEYLFGAVTLDEPTQGTLDPEAPSPVETFTSWWTDTRAGEKAAFEQFVDWATERLATHPGAHIYHYAPYEPAALKRLAARHGTREDAIDQLLRTGALVDLYATVRKGIRVSQRSYSIKYLEPLYMPAGRVGDVKNAAASIEAYEQYLAERDTGNDVAADASKQAILEYNEYDCVSTHRLHRWLLGLRDQSGVAAREAAPAAVEESESVTAARDAVTREEALAAKLTGHLPDDPASWTNDDRAWHLLAGAVGYYRREANPEWWDFFAQAEADLADLERDSKCLVPLRCDATDWQAPTGRQRNARRDLTFTCDPDLHQPFDEGDKVRMLYPSPAGSAPVTTTAQVLTASGTRLTVTETSPPDAARGDVPVALLPTGPVPAKPKDGVVLELAERVAEAGELPDVAALDLLRRRPPRLRTRANLPEPSAHGGDVIAAVIAAVDELDDSYLAVQGPPGAGKTYLATQLIRHLTATGRTVGVCAPGHKAVENVLTGVAAADPSIPIVKRPARQPDPAAPWVQPKTSGDLAKWRFDQPGAHVVGGTSWVFANADVIADPLDVLIIDEAGQFALTDVIAVSAAARNLVLLGDPQQLPQVVKGTHPDGVDVSALGHLLGTEPLIPERFGYFLDVTRRMHPNVCAPVSNLSYRGRLHAHETTTARRVDGLEAGLYTRFVDHTGNTTHSPEEVAAVVAVVDDLVGRTWHEGGASRPLTGRDILVVAPYNVQVQALSRALEKAGHGQVRVGTVDRFQGQEAPVVIASMSSSSSADVPRGLDFLLSRNRMNVALSRAQAVAVLVCSPELTRAQVRTVEQMRLVAGLLGLIEDGTYLAP